MKVRGACKERMITGHEPRVILGTVPCSYSAKLNKTKSQGDDSYDNKDKTSSLIMEKRAAFGESAEAFAQAKG